MIYILFIKLYNFENIFLKNSRLIKITIDLLNTLYIYCAYCISSD